MFGLLTDLALLNKVCHRFFETIPMKQFLHSFISSLSAWMPSHGRIVQGFNDFCLQSSISSYPNSSLVFKQAVFQRKFRFFIGITTSFYKRCWALQSISYELRISWIQTGWLEETAGKANTCPTLDRASAALLSSPFLYWNWNWRPINLVMAFLWRSEVIAWVSKWHKLLWSVLITNGPLHTYGLHLSMAIIIARNSFSYMLNFWLAGPRDLL